MRAIRLGRWLLLAGVLSAVGGCGYVKSLFPDKERDYQFTTEIPELVVPDDLKNKTFPTRAPAATRTDTPAPVAATASVPVETAETSSSAAAEPAAAKPREPAAKPEVAKAPVEPAPGVSPAESAGERPQRQTSDGVSSLEIDQSIIQAWWLVSKSLSRQKLEIVERNMDKGYFFVKYDPNAIKPEDGSILDEFNFMFGDDPSQELEYRISLQALSADATEVTVQDSEGRSLSNAAATSLLRLITDGIKQDLPADGEPAAQP
ncbi:outer membrane protein assembly factor BamC [Methylomonas sp. MED-D]|uniref:outer membrane protein assembly factor BamC n=1 Tax=unclassified Methylomonas TaxID=2608980 RepID=UPI0028A4EA1A|nr:outer membrane protein assembly factor BamC [Methylomonas sp. MV1]MDT4331827.1 outer membrane protein assembly factor BamC [Methylomonas sp. MV1]